jgi:hypothetical protein
MEQSIEAHGLITKGGSTHSLSTIDSQSDSLEPCRSVHESESVRRPNHRYAHSDSYRAKGMVNRGGRRHIPNLLSGVPLLPGPMTPQFAPVHVTSPDSFSHQVAIFPAFMVAPDSIPDVDGEFMKCAMESAIGLPPLFNLPESGYFFEPAGVEDIAQQRSRSKGGKKQQSSTPRKPPSNDSVFPPRSRDMPIIESNFDFPILENMMSSSATTVATTPSLCPSPSPRQAKLSHAKFPSKSRQMKCNKSP